MKRNRKDNELPEATAKWGWRFHHLGIPTNIPREDEEYIAHLKIHVAGFKTSPYGIEWMRFDNNCPISNLIRTTPHIAFEVDNIETELKRLKINSEISSPSNGVRVAMIEHNGAPIELIEFSEKSK